MQDTPNSPKEKLTRAHKIALAFISLACCALIGGSCFALANPNAFSSENSSQTEQSANQEEATAENASDSNSQNESTNGAADTSSAGTTATTTNQNNSTAPSNSSNNQPSSNASGNTAAANNTDNKPKTVTVSVSVSSSAADGRVSGSAHPTFSQGATVYDALCATGLSVSASQTTYGIYVSAIGGLAEKEFGGSSGWMYSVNGSVPQTACSNYILKDGDVVSWYYVV